MLVLGLDRIIVDAILFQDLEEVLVAAKGDASEHVVVPLLGEHVFDVVSVV